MSEASRGLTSPARQVANGAGRLAMQAAGRFWEASTSRPGARKALGPAGLRHLSGGSGPRPAGLPQAEPPDKWRRPIAGLKQPSSRRMTDETLGRRITALVQGTQARRCLHIFNRDTTPEFNPLHDLVREAPGRPASGRCRLRLSRKPSREGCASDRSGGAAPPRCRAPELDRSACRVDTPSVVAQAFADRKHRSERWPLAKEKSLSPLPTWR